jgi:hypothetical protein
MPPSASTGRGLTSHEQVRCVAMGGKAKATRLRIVRLERPQHFLLQGGNNACIKEKVYHIDSDLLTSETPSPLPDQQVFHEYLLTYAKSAVRVVIEPVMHEELDLFKRYRCHTLTGMRPLPSTPHRTHLPPTYVLSLWSDETKGVARDSSHHMITPFFGNRPRRFVHTFLAHGFLPASLLTHRSCDRCQLLFFLLVE